jgi:hypothetical protein
MKTKAIFYHVGCPVCVAVEQNAAQALAPARCDIEIVHRGQQKARLAEAEKAGVKSVPAWVLGGQAFHINCDASPVALRRVTGRARFHRRDEIVNCAVIRSSIAAEDAVAEDFGAQTAAALQRLFGAGREGVVHPVTRPAFFRPKKPNALQREFFADERVEVQPLGDHVAAVNRRRRAGLAEFLAELPVDFESEERNLALEPENRS